MASAYDDCALNHQTKIPIGFGVGGDWTLDLLFNHRNFTNWVN